MADDEPPGLYMSLDQLIKTQQDKQPRLRSEGGGSQEGGQQRRFEGQGRPARRQQYQGRGQRQQFNQQAYQQQGQNGGGYGKQQRGGYHQGASGGGYHAQQQQGIPYQGAYEQLPQQPVQQAQPFFFVTAAPALSPQQPPPPQRPPPPQQPRQDRYRESQQCTEDEVTGDIVFQYRQQELVRISPSGDVMLGSGGVRDATTLASLNDALNLIGIRVTAPGGATSGADWSISDGRSLTRFFDGVMLPAKGPQHAARGRQMLLAFKAPNRGLAAAATAASNAAATAAGILPPTGHRPRGSFPAPGQPVADEQQQQQQEEEQRNGGGVFSRLGATAAVDDDRTRRLRAQGRYLPY